MACQTLNMERGRIDDELRNRSIGGLHLSPTAILDDIAPAFFDWMLHPCQRHGKAALHLRLVAMATKFLTAGEMRAGETKADGKPCRLQGKIRRFSRCRDNLAAGPSNQNHVDYVGTCASSLLPSGHAALSGARLPAREQNSTGL